MKTTAKKPAKAQSRKTLSDEGDLLPHYDFDYSKGRPNRFAADLPTGARIVTLDPDVAEAFADSESVNAVLRALLATMPKPVRQTDAA